MGARQEPAARRVSAGASKFPQRREGRRNAHQEPVARRVAAGAGKFPQRREGRRNAHQEPVARRVAAGAGQLAPRRERWGARQEPAALARAPPHAAPPAAARLPLRQERARRGRCGGCGAGPPAAPPSDGAPPDAVAGVARDQVPVPVAVAHAALAADSGARGQHQQQERPEHAQAARGDLEAAAVACSRTGDRGATLRPRRGGSHVAAAPRQAAARPPPAAATAARGGGERGIGAPRRGGRGRGRGEEAAVGDAAAGHGGAQPRGLLGHRQRPDVRVGRRLLRPPPAVQVRRRSERDRLRLLDRAILRRDPPPDLTHVHIPEQAKLLLQPVPGPGSGVPPDVGVVGGRVSQRPVGVEVRHGRLQQEDQQRPVAVVHRVPHARSQRAHLHGQSLQHGLSLTG